jgi:hypothetical protein
MKSHFVRHFFTLYHTDEGESKPTIKYNKSSTPFMHECVMMSEHLVHYLRSLAAKFNAAKFQAIAHQRRNSGDKMSAEALRRWGMSALEDDKEALHTWNTMQELLSAQVSQTTSTTKVHVYLIPDVESGRYPRPGLDYAAVVYSYKVG